MIGSDTYLVGTTAVRKGGCYGFAVMRSDQRCSFPLVATLRYAGGLEALVIREGVWYGGDEQILELSLATTAGSFNYEVYRGSRRDDLAAPVTPQNLVGESVVSFTSPTAGGAATAAWTQDLPRPAWARRGQLIYLSISAAGANPGVGVSSVDPAYVILPPVANITFPRVVLSIGDPQFVGQPGGLQAIDSNVVQVIPPVLRVRVNAAYDPNQFGSFAMLWG